MSYWTSVGKRLIVDKSGWNFGFLICETFLYLRDKFCLWFSIVSEETYFC